MVKNGVLDYFGDTGNWIDLVYIVSSILMSQLHDNPDIGPYFWFSKLLMIIVAILAIRRTFTLLRIFKVLSPIVTMLNNVIWDLRIFLTFYMILVVLFSLVYGVIGLQNPNIPDSRYKEAYYIVPEGQTKPEIDPEVPGFEYSLVGQLVGNVINVIRVSLGDFGIIGPSVYLESNDNILFWVLFFLTLILTNIVFLNFIVAEASASYSEVSEKLEEYMELQRSDLVAEAEALYPDFLKTKNKFPKYLAIRKVG